jgi:F-type H+-transporting ATPase subunit b
VEIDLFTFVIQIINFLILVALLRIFLYKPIIRAMDEREKKIADRLKEAEDIKREADQEAEENRQERAKLEGQRQEFLTQAKEEAEERRKELMENVRKEADAMQQRWRETLEREKKAFLFRLRQRAGEEVFSVARRALADLANTDLEIHIVEVFLERLGELDDEQRQELNEALPHSNGRIKARSAFEVPDDMRKKIEKAIHDQFENHVEIQFEVVPDLIGGIELKVHGREVNWSLASYLNTLEERLGSVLEEELR